jgi:hypothetical protein
VYIAVRICEKLTSLNNFSYPFFRMCFLFASLSAPHSFVGFEKCSNFEAEKVKAKGYEQRYTGIHTGT